jgi:hypothetical protein
MLMTASKRRNRCFRQQYPEKETQKKVCSVRARTVGVIDFTKKELSRQPFT